MSSMTPFEALGALRHVSFWQRSLPSRAMMEAHAQEHPWAPSRPDGVARGLWAARARGLVSLFALFSDGSSDRYLVPSILPLEGRLAELAPLVEGWMRLSAEGRPVPAGANLSSWPYAFFADSTLWEACSPFSNWSRTARAGVAEALRRKGHPASLMAATLADLATLSAGELRAVPGLGPSTVRFLSGVLERAGLAFAPDDPEASSDEALLDRLPTRRRPPAAPSRRSR